MVAAEDKCGGLSTPHSTRSARSGFGRDDGAGGLGFGRGAAAGGRLRAGLEAELKRTGVSGGYAC
jgi:hypothetical protein